MEEVIEEKETAQAQTVKYGRGMRIRKKPVSYEPVMTGKTYQRGVNNLCYRRLGNNISSQGRGRGYPYGGG